MTATCKYRGRPSRNGSWTDSQGLKPSAARKVEPTECRAHDAAAVAAGASDHVHGTTKDDEGSDHPHLHGTAAVAGATGLSPITAAPAGACDHERTTAGAADAADPAGTSRTAFFSKSCIPLASVWCSGARSGGDTESHEEAHKETQAGAAYTRRAVSGAPSNGPTVRPSVSTQSAKWECSREPTASAQSTHCKCSASPAVTPSLLRFWICRARRVRPSRWSRPSTRHRFAHRCGRRQIHAERQPCDAPLSVNS